MKFSFVNMLFYFIFNITQWKWLLVFVKYIYASTNNKIIQFKSCFCCLFVGADLNIFQGGNNWNIAQEACQKKVHPIKEKNLTLEFEKIIKVLFYRNSYTAGDGRGNIFAFATFSIFWNFNKNKKEIGRQILLLSCY